MRAAQREAKAPKHREQLVMAFVWEQRVDREVGAILYPKGFKFGAGAGAEEGGDD